MRRLPWFKQEAGRQDQDIEMISMSRHGIGQLKQMVYGL